MIAFGIIIFESSINDFVLLINFYLQDGKCSILRNREWDFRDYTDKIQPHKTSISSKYTRKR